MKNRLRCTTLLAGLALLALVAACQAPTAAPPTGAPEPPPTAASTAMPTASAEPSPDADQVRGAIVSALLSLNTRSNRLDSVTTLAERSSCTWIVFGKKLLCDLGVLDRFCHACRMSRS